MDAVYVHEVQDILRSMYLCRREIVPCLIGAPGIGKTEGIQAFAEEKGVKLVTFILSNSIPSEVSGIRMPDKETKKLEVFDDARMSSLEDGDILFFDEILEAPRELWTACLTLIQNRVMASGRKLPDVFIVAASNPVNNPIVIPPSVRDRFLFMQVLWNRESWSDWWKAKYGTKVPRNILDNIQTDSDEYNMLTPRKVEKLCKWYCIADNHDLVEDMIGRMFGRHIAMGIKSMCIRDNDFKKDLCNELMSEFGIERINDKVLLDCDLKTILDVLQSLPEWPAIEEKLACMEWDETQTSFIIQEES